MCWETQLTLNILHVTNRQIQTISDANFVSLKHDFGVQNFKPRLF